MDIIFCAGGNPRFATIAMEEGMLYGIRSDYKGYLPVHFLDIHWKRYNWQRHLAMVERYKPAMVMVADYESREQYSTMMQQVQDLRAMGVSKILVCPKFKGACADIPKDCILALSVYSDYAGYLPPDKELRGRTVHLLGGTPLVLVGLCRRYGAQGIRVGSVDTNQHLKACWFGTYFNGRKWINRGKHRMTNEEAFRKSSYHIVRVLSNLDKRYGSRQVKRACDVCGIAWVPDHPRARYHSDACRQKAYRRRQIKFTPVQS